MNTGEEICGEWLRHVAGCEFVQYNLKTSEVQGEIDVLGLNLKRRRVYACEVAVHLITGLQYVKANRPDNVPRLTAKLRRDLSYLRSSFPEYEHVLMLWSPVVKDQRPGSKYNQLRDVAGVVKALHEAEDAEVVPVVNEGFQAALDELRAFASSQTKELDSAVIRYLQIEEHLKGHLARLRSGADSS